MKLTLNMAISAATTVICDGYEIDEFTTLESGVMRLACSDAHEVTVDTRQEVDINDDGQCNALDQGGNEVSFEFKVLVPLAQCHL